jgi:hypothetical protein
MQTPFAAAGMGLGMIFGVTSHCMTRSEGVASRINVVAPSLIGIIAMIATSALLPSDESQLSMPAMTLAMLVAPAFARAIGRAVIPEWKRACAP